MASLQLDVVEALVREYLVRANCTSALDAYNREKPKHSNSITKREVLRKALGLDKAAAYYKKQNPTVESLPSTLELWVNYQMAKLASGPEAPISTQSSQASRPARTPPREADDPEESSAPVPSPALTRRPPSGSGAASAAPAPASASPAKDTAPPRLVPLATPAAAPAKASVPLPPVPAQERLTSRSSLAPIPPHSASAPAHPQPLATVPTPPPPLSAPVLGLPPPRPAPSPIRPPPPPPPPSIPALRGSIDITPAQPRQVSNSVPTTQNAAPAGTQAATHATQARRKTSRRSSKAVSLPQLPTAASTAAAATAAATSRRVSRPPGPPRTGAGSGCSAPCGGKGPPPPRVSLRPLAGAHPGAAAAQHAPQPAAQQGGAVRPGPPRQGFGFGDPAPPAARAAAPGPGTRRVLGTSSRDEDEDEEPEIIRPAATPGRGAAATASSSRTSASRSVGANSSPPAVRSAAAAPSQQQRMGAGLRGGGGELVMEDVGDVCFDDEGDVGAAAPTSGFGAMRISGPATRKPGAPVSPELMRQLRQLLWGGQGQPPPSWKQGFFFSRHAGLQFGLVQRQGGPCGVLAAVQAHVLAALHVPSSGGFNTSPRPQEQLTALAAALSESLWQARMGPTAALLLPEGEAGGAAGRLGYDALSRTVAQHTAASKEALTELVRGSLTVLMAEDGWGVVLFVMSLALTRGVANVQADMDEPGNSLMGMHGYCTQELVNLILLGTANSNVFDGNQQLDGTTTLKGVSRRCRLGLLTLFEWYKYVEVGPSLKNPSLPVWVVCSESHFTVLFAQDARALQNQLPFDLFYYDELANQESIIRLSVAKDPRGGWTARVGSTMGDRGKCEGQNIPPLECVIETRWPGVKVNWNGHEPIL
ncbi:hypothetical protein Agub_g8703 [Astrephomene gubernaculifera]|uniref:Probable ubiquitin carboxyl-terminal hydrolase MINDY-4 n=1 Tax=Astrephomene gubernaculifera TaxID=47775 RepID=A0AAD3DTV8_9CHLO|nr:hypothetical protein Agub_g8703 [Astrephomene gubernaculifera]